MALDLSALEEKPVASAAAAPSPAELGKPLRLKIVDVEPDPNQPRTEKKPEEIAEIGASIKERGVKQPISVKSHPSKPGKWMINDGELRWLGTQWAEIDDIPVVIDEDFDDFDQVNANEKRFALRPMELAKFVKRKLDEGIKKAEIARRLGKPATAITELLSLIDAPQFVEAVYSSGRCSSPKTLYELRLLADKFPEQVQEWCEKAVDVTRRAVLALGDSLKEKKSGAENLSHDKGSGGQHEQSDDGNSVEGGSNVGEVGGAGKVSTSKDSGVKSSDAKDSGQAPSSKNLGAAGDDAEAGRDTGELTSWPKGRAVSDPDRMTKPLMLVEYDGRAAAVLLNRRPTSVGLIHIRFEDGGGDQEVAASMCKINLLTESEK